MWRLLLCLPTTFYPVYNQAFPKSIFPHAMKPNYPTMSLFVFPANLPVDTTYASPPLLITGPKNADCFLLTWAKYWGLSSLQKPPRNIIMAEAHPSEDDILTCGICLEFFNEPKVLPCLHRFCESCLNRHITESVSTTTGELRGFPCPCCRGFIRAKYPTSPQQEWAAQFKTDFVIKELVSFRSRAPAEINYSCPTHTKIVCDYYCFDCSRILCHRCALESHRGCKQVSNLTEATNDRKIKLRHAIENMKTQLEQAERSEYLGTEMKRVIEDTRDEVAAAITTWEQDVIKRVADEKEKLFKQLNMKCGGLIIELSSEIVKVNKIKNTVEGCLKTALSKLSLPDVDTMLDNSVLDITREWESDSPQVSEFMNRVITNVNGVQITFRKASPESEYLGSLVSADCLQDTAGVCDHSQATASNDDKPSIADITLNQPNNIQVLRTIDIPCGRQHLSGVIVVAPSNSIIVTEVWNSSVIMITSTGETQTGIYLKGKPAGITQVSDNLLVVSLPFSEKICLIHITPTLKVERYITCKSYTSLATFDSTTLVAASTFSLFHIDIINLNGEVLRSFSRSNNIDIPTSTQHLYSGIYESIVYVFSGGSPGDILMSRLHTVCGLIVTPDKMILATFPKDDYLLCLSPDGETKFKYLQRKIKGVACDSSGCIFLVADDRLFILTPDGQPDRTLVLSTDNILTSPTGVYVDTDGHVYVLNDKCREIKVLKVKGRSAI